MIKDDELLQNTSSEQIATSDVSKVDVPNENLKSNYIALFYNTVGQKELLSSDKSLVF